jgi:hypothetical protein
MVRLSLTILSFCRRTTLSNIEGQSTPSSENNFFRLGARKFLEVVVQDLED